ncbi:MAG: mismatch-specific DNA-glycosylase [Microthrixaceae bacterium]
MSRASRDSASGDASDNPSDNPSVEGADLADILAGGPRTEVPIELWRLRAATPVGRRFHVPADVAQRWPTDLLAATLEGGAFNPSEGVYVRARTLADLVGADLRVLIVGLNPSLVAADAGVGFAGATNRFWPAALDAGLVSVDRDPLHAFEHHRIGMSDLVKRATVSAKELSTAQYRHGIRRLETTVRWLRPRAVCVVGITGWRAARDRSATIGWQDEGFGTTPVYVMPNPSGLNAHVSRAELAEHFHTVASATHRA